MSAFALVWLVVSIPITWVFLSKIETGFVFFTTISNYILYKLMLCIILGFIVAPISAIYCFIKADAKERKIILGIVGIFLVLELGAYSYDHVQEERADAQSRKEYAEGEQQKAKAQAQMNALNKSQSQQATTMGNVTPNTTPNTSTINRMNVDDFKIGWARLGGSVNDANGNGGFLSKEKTAEGNVSKFTTLQVVADDNGVINNIATDNVNVFVSRGIHATSPVNEVIKKYGPDFHKTTYNNVDLYEYEMSNGNHTKNILRFAVDQKTNNVSYIGSRVAAE